MKIEKNKIVVGSIIAITIIFLISYTIMITGDDQKEDNNLKQTTVPELREDPPSYDSKLDAINDLKEVRETNVPSIYDEKLMDSLGYYDAELPEKKKQHVIDSIYFLGERRYAEVSTVAARSKKSIPRKVQSTDTSATREEMKIQAKEMGLEHQLFFASNPKSNNIATSETTDSEILAVVDGTQVVRANSRIRLRLYQDATIGNKPVPKNTPIFGFVSFQPNRVLIEIENLKHQPTALKAFDLQDGSEGIYVENNFREEATTEVLDDLLGEINIPSVPQVSGIGKLLKTKNRNVKVTILNNYKLILKPGL
ncbi:conjugal transfer protein TraM [Christiangramia fulva]|uniref:Conjugal transfer protein TraM n=1 Tax=Christiangramia fulva TaxID=2126553 RepID=A0A2R3Z8E2_9FLAO|nr:conjugative transposon protein TraM [Christiangramia fulva]AVR46505.1 conjugal transfer protein TraM [Christiangramia fulva]